jgi:hypothetical protein
MTKIVPLFASFLLALSAFAGTPQSTVEGFYSSYLKYLQSVEGKSRSLEKFNAEERAATEPFFTPGYSKKITSRAKACANTKEPTAACDGDFFYCAQEAPDSFEVKETKMMRKSASSIVALCFHCAKDPEKRNVKIGLKRVGKDWKISSVQCPQINVRD